MTDDSPLTFSLPAVSRKKVTAAFDGGRLSSDSGVILLSLAERRRAVARTLAALIDDPRDPAHITHTVEDVLRARMLAIACGYPDGNDFHFLRSDPAFKLACGRLPDTGADLCSQPTDFALGERADAERDRPAHLCADRYLVRKLLEAAGLGGSGYRRHARYRAWPPETGGMERSLRRALLSADPHLRHGHRPPGGRDPAPRQDAIGQGSPRLAAPPRPPHPPALARARASPSAATAITAARRR